MKSKNGFEEETKVNQSLLGKRIANSEIQRGYILRGKGLTLSLLSLKNVAKPFTVNWDCSQFDILFYV